MILVIKSTGGGLYFKTKDKDKLPISVIFEFTNFSSDGNLNPKFTT